MGHLIAPFLIVPVLVLAGFLFAANVRGQAPVKASLSFSPVNLGFPSGGLG